MKMTLAEFEELEKRYLFEVLKNPDYRIGQAFINDYRDISNSIMGDEEGVEQDNRLWLARSRERVLELIERYIEK